MLINYSVSAPAVEIRAKEARTLGKSGASSQQSRPDADVQQLLSRFPLDRHNARLPAGTSPLSLSHPKHRQKPQGNP